MHRSECICHLMGTSKCGNCLVHQVGWNTGRAAEYVAGQAETQVQEQSASKNDQDKVDLSLIPMISNIEHAKAFMVGEKKYGRYNYTKGHKASQLAAAAQRHLNAWFNGEEHDPKDGQHHLGSVMACCSMILRQAELGTLKDDRFKKDD